MKSLMDIIAKVDYSPTSFAGFKLERDRERRTLTLSMPQKIVEAAREHMPELLRSERPTVLSGKRLADAADSLKLADREGKLSPQQVRTQSTIGHLKFVERVQPRLALVIHRLSCVMSSPPPEAYEVARAALCICVAALVSSTTRWRLARSSRCADALAAYLPRLAALCHEAAASPPRRM